MLTMQAADGLQVVPTLLPGCYELQPAIVEDRRGFFSKLFHQPLWQAQGLCTHFEEDYVTHSVRGVVRGLHFQLPPMAHCKVVFCLRGEALDVAVDLRVGSPTFGKHLRIVLSGAQGNGVYLPPGIAHGFCVIGEDALLHYRVSTVYSPRHDSGIRWDSAGIDWPAGSPLLSDRDRLMIAFDDFESPFRFDPERL